MQNHAENQIVPNVLMGQPAGMSVERIGYHGWHDCYLLSNGIVEAAIVPAIGRVMQLRLVGDAVGVFWENRALDGQLPDPHSTEWLNLGGDKGWPAPQIGWAAAEGREWPPPAAFDALPVDVTVGAGSILLTAPLDAGYGIQELRHVELVSGKPQMRIRTEYRKLSGAPVRVGVWTITQLPDPERAFMLLPEHSYQANGYIRLMPEMPAALKVDGRLLSLKRAPAYSAKIGSMGHKMAWVGAKAVVLIEAEQGPGEYPDGGCMTQIYTNADPLQYIELETLGPLTNLGVGDRAERTTIYTVLRRTADDAEAEARKVL